MTLRGLVTAIVLGILAATAPAEVSEGPVGEYDVKAAFLYNFAKFVRWPDESFADEAAPFRVCVLGDDPFGETLDDTFAGKVVRRRTAVIDRVTTASAARGCHILFVSESEHRRLRWILDEVRGESVLTIADVEEFAARGGIVHLVLEQRRVRFEINVDAAERAGLRVSSQLLKLARRVWSDRGEGPP